MHQSSKLSERFTKFQPKLGVNGETNNFSLFN